jgi:YjbE family integral membrane protein
MSLEAFYTFLQVVVIDLTLAGDNAIAIGMAAAGLPVKDRRRAIIFGMSAAVVLRIAFGLITVQLMQVIGLLFAGGVLLLYVCWKMWTDLRDAHHHAQDEGEAALEDATGGPAAAGAAKQPKGLRQAMVQILLADVSMSLDNVLAVAGAAREHPWVLLFGLLLAVGVTAVAASWIARMLNRMRWLGYVGLALVLYVALNMIWHGHRDVVQQMGWTAQYNSYAPAFADIRPGEGRH